MAAEKKSYYVNDRAQANGDHEVHREGCQYLPMPANRTYLGSFDNCDDAVSAAKKHYRPGERLLHLLAGVPHGLKAHLLGFGGIDRPTAPR